MNTKSNPVPARKETLKIDLKIDIIGFTKKEIRRIEKLFNCITNDVLTHGDSALINYSFDIEYFGNVVNRLKYILELSDKAKILHVNINELRHSKSVIQELLIKLEQIEQKYRDKNAL